MMPPDKQRINGINGGLCLMISALFITPMTILSYALIHPMAVLLHSTIRHKKETISPITDTAIKDDIGKDTPQAPYFDSRPKPVPEGALLQHFLGQMLKTSQPVFDPSIATLMDFRCDQSQGLHFIYLLPTAPDTALIESTLFTDTPFARCLL